MGRPGSQSSTEGVCANSHVPLHLFPYMRTLELLAPAKNLECGIAAISHGADAVYIGADHFGARASAGNSVADIQTLCDFAHLFGAKVYVTVNTIIYDNELDATQELITRLAEVGVDALLVQDMATLAMRRVALAKVGRVPLLHSSTQMDNRTAEKVAWLRDLGFTRAVLARELSVEEIKAIHEAVPEVELEVFVHGALCVSYSGQCYASQRLFGRSANRGECAQVCRMSYDLVDADGREVVKDRYLLSMKDLCMVDHLEELADAGASSFKIEGRLKDADYVKNVVAAYSQRLNNIIKRRGSDYRRASWGRVDYSFQPDLAKTFNRGYTEYFLKGRQHGLSTMVTPKALGEFVGTVKDLRGDSFRVSGTATFANGDGLCFVKDQADGNAQQGELLEGFRVNRVEGNRLFPFHMPRGLRRGMALYRNNDVAFGKALAGETAHRVIPVSMEFGTTNDGFRLAMRLDTGEDKMLEWTVETTFEHQQANRPQEENIRKQLSKLGGTIFELKSLTIDQEAKGLFIPSSVLAQLRRDAVAAYAKALETKPADVDLTRDQEGTDAPARFWSEEYKKYPYLFNVANHEARAFYEAHGMSGLEPALETAEPRSVVAMQCRYCIRYELGFCVRRGGKKPEWREPLTLRLGDGRGFRLDFRCGECQMNLLSAD